MAKRSIQLNHLGERIEIINKNIKDIFDVLEPNSIDVIVTNPPYMKKNTGAVSEEKRKLISRHEVECTIEDIVKISYKLLKSKSEFYMIHRTDRLVDIIYTLRKSKLEPKEIRFVSPQQEKEPNLFLIKCIKDGGEQLKIQKPLIIYDKDNQYTEEVLRIYNKI
jgi:tRNA1Val (adenine37-N6)-methyltransferase